VRSAAEGLGDRLHPAREPRALGAALEVPGELRSADVVELAVQGE
jgi:hypothetical protein